MNQVIFHKHTDAMGEYYFKCRNQGIKFTKEMVKEINEQVDHLCTLFFTNDELDYLRSIRFIKNDYVEFLRLYRPIREYVEIKLLDNQELYCAIKGPCFSAMFFEIYLLEIINEVYFRFAYNYDELEKIAKSKLQEKIDLINNHTYTFKFAEFGCRRRLSKSFQDYMVHELISKTNACVGTSNVFLAKKYHITPIGTFAHEFVQMYQGYPYIPLAYTNHYALKDWFSEYNGDNGIALTDTLTTDLFLIDFDFLNASCYQGVRHDSGDPYVWGDKMIAHYQKLGINPKEKTLLFSDSLNFDKAQKIYDYFKDKVKVSFGIGTYLANDTNVEPLNIVIKLQKVNSHPVAKLSDSDGKTMCLDDEYLTYLNAAVEYRVKEEGKIKK
jgi:nicotinate phosphoribosyltransferase